MPKRPVVVAAAAAACVLFVAASSAPQDPARPRLANAYGDWLVTHVGRSFDLSGDRTLAVQSDQGGCKLLAVGQDFVLFETQTSRVAIPFPGLRVEVGNSCIAIRSPIRTIAA